MTSRFIDCANGSSQKNQSDRQESVPIITNKTGEASTRAIIPAVMGNERSIVPINHPAQVNRGCLTNISTSPTLFASITLHTNGTQSGDKQRKDDFEFFYTRIAINYSLGSSGRVPGSGFCHFIWVAIQEFIFKFIFSRLGLRLTIWVLCFKRWNSNKWVFPL